jgi:hypothetical protein
MSSEETTSQIEVVEQPKPKKIIKIKNYKKLYYEQKERNELLKKTNKYLMAKENIRTSKQNKGEKDEVLCLIYLFHLNETSQFDKLRNIFGEEAADGIQILHIDSNDEIVDINDLSKAKSCYKADFKMRMKKTLNVYTPSIKSKNGANPAILNHTSRNAKIFQEGGILYDCLPCLDKILEEYIVKRIDKTIGEDTSITNLVCLNDNELKEIFIKVLIYFGFDGTGKGYSKCRANAIIEYHNDKITFINCDNTERKTEYINSIYNRIVISLRDKGLPKLIPEYCEPWIFNDIKPDNSIKHKGSLHIRIK